MSTLHHLAPEDFITFKLPGIRYTPCTSLFLKKPSLVNDRLIRLVPPMRLGIDQHWWQQSLKIDTPTDSAKPCDIKGTFSSVWVSFVCIFEQKIGLC